MREYMSHMHLEQYKLVQLFINQNIINNIIIKI